ncbi:MAG: Type I signal peptidase, partial [Candidatus Woesebacteria bacterium GW2011_GWD1_38_10]
PSGENGEPEYVTKGDANEDFDPPKISDKDIIGKVRLTIPYLGYLAFAAKKPWGFILLVIVPATIFIYEELKAVLKELRKRMGKHSQC